MIDTSSYFGSDQWHKDQMNLSKWWLMSDYYEAKLDIFKRGRSKLNDQEILALEGTIKAVHGEEFFNRFSCTTYDFNQHLIVKNLYAWFKGIDDKWVAIKNENAMKANAIAQVKMSKKITIIKEEKLQEDPVEQYDTRPYQDIPSSTQLGFIF